VRWEIISAELNNVAQTERLYVTAVYQRALRDLAADEAALDERLLGIVQRSFEANLTTIDKVSVAQVTARAARQQADLAETQFQAALFALRGQLNLAPGEELRLNDDLSRWHWLPATHNVAGVSTVDGRDPCSDRQTIVALVADRPDLLAAQASLESAQAAVGLAQANKVQNITVGPTYERDESGTLFFGLRTGMPLPIWDTGEPLANQRRAEARLQRVTWQQLEVRAVVEADAAIARYERARQLVSGFGADYTQNLDAELRAMEDQYKAGQTDIFSVYATRSGITQQRRAYLDLLNEAAQAAATVTQATGLLPDKFIERPAAEASPPDGHDQSL
jgi:outer membrane protein TolC